MKNFILLCLGLMTFPAWGQMGDSFDDGDFTNNPTWTGNTADFIVNTNNELQLNATDPGESYLVTPHNLNQLEDKEWRVRVKYAFAPSNNNRGNTYLTATDPDLSTDPDGIFFKIGENGSDDPIQLIERNGGTETTILTSTPGIVANSFDVNVKIIYRTNGDWELYTDLAGGDAFQLDASVNYPTTLLGTYLGVQLKYTTTNKTNFYYDDFYAGDIQVDNIPPNLDTVIAIASNTLTVQFDEVINQASGEQVSNYTVSDGIGNPLSITQDPNDLTKFELSFGASFNVGQTYTISVDQVEDLAGNAMSTQSKSFLYMEAQTPVYGDIIINEFFPRPTPSNGLPESQFVELYNRSNKYFNLNGWKLSDNSTSGTIQEVWMQPGDYVVLVPSSGLVDYPNATKVTSWAQLNISGDEIHLSTDDGFMVNELTYTDAWYQDEAKKAGGWTLERINPTAPCSPATNWQASVDPMGGTPGVENSVFDTTPDLTLPQVTSVFAELPNQLTVTFSKDMDSMSLANINFASVENLSIAQVTLDGHFPKKMIIEFNETFEVGTIYEFTLNNFSDCMGNNNDYEGSFIIPKPAEKGDIIINEILFNPLTGGSDFVELYNVSDKHININGWEFANVKDNEISSKKTISVNYILQPKDYVVMTKDTNFLIMNYPVAVPGKFIQMDLPSYTNDSSTVYLLRNDTVMDKVAYEKEWHFALLQSDKGVSLERISADLPSNSPDNWHSASETIGFATPGRKNSQQVSTGGEGTLTLSSSTFSPDEDGYEDVLLLSYQMDTPDLLGNITIYDDRGRLVKTLMESHLLGAEGVIQWDGVTDQGDKAKIGPHIIIFEIFNLDKAKQQTIRKVVSVAGRM